MNDDRTEAPAASQVPARWNGLRVLAVLLAIAGALLLAFGWWGTHTAAARFGDGFVPIGGATLGGLLIIGGVIVDLVAERRSRKAAR